MWIIKYGRWNTVLDIFFIKSAEVLITCGPGLGLVILVAWSLREFLLVFHITAILTLQPTGTAWGGMRNPLIGFITVYCMLQPPIRCSCSKDLARVGKWLGLTSPTPTNSHIFANLWKCSTLYIHTWSSVQPSELWCFWMGGRNCTQLVKTVLVTVIWLELGIARVKKFHGGEMIGPSSLSCCSKILNGFTFWYRFTKVVLGQWPLSECRTCKLGLTSTVWQCMVKPILA